MNKRVKCALCHTNIADKTNTHYLSDSIIRKALNLKGTNKRGYGFSYSLSTTELNIDFNFQRNVNDTDLKRVLGRSATEEEIQKSMSFTIYSVDYIFCKSCEDIFSKIENDFTPIYTTLLSKEGIENDSDYMEFDSTKVRLFAYIQFFRSSICDSRMVLPIKFINILRIAILNSEPHKDIPLNITFLKTDGGDRFFTENYVGYAEGNHDPHIIFMNNLILQLYKHKDLIKYDHCFGLNNEDVFKERIQINEVDSFKIHLYSNKRRKQILNKINTHIVDSKMSHLFKIFYWEYVMRYAKLPTNKIIGLFSNSLIELMNNNHADINFIKFVHTFINRQYRK